MTTRYLRTDVVDQLFARIGSDAESYWYLTDHLGSIRDITDNSGVGVDALTYDAFGNIISETDSTYRGRYAWTGRELDVETDLQYNRARYYDASTGRWLSQDPLGFEAGDSNLYRYVSNRPTTATDPSGNILVAWDSFTAKEYLKWFQETLNLKSVEAHQVTSGRWVFLANDRDEIRKAINQAQWVDHDQGRLELLNAMSSRDTHLQVRWYYDENGPYGSESGKKWNFFRETVTPDVYEQVLYEHNDLLVRWIELFGRFPTNDEHLETAWGGMKYPWGIAGYKFGGWDIRLDGGSEAKRLPIFTPLYEEFRDTEISRVQRLWDTEQAKMHALNHLGWHNPIGENRPNLPRERSPWDLLPIIGSVRDFLYHIRNNDPQAALFSGAMLAAELYPAARLGYSLLRTATSAIVRNTGVRLLGRSANGLSRGHHITWELRSGNGQIRTRGTIQSGLDVAPGRRLSWNEQLATHTERKLINELKGKVKQGDIITIRGTKPPCNPGGRGCQSIMEQFARENGITIRYVDMTTGELWIFPR